MSRTLRIATAAAIACTGLAQAQTLTGWAQLPAATFADGPTSGQFAGPNPYGTNLPPYVAQQPVQGFSGVLRGTGRHTFKFLVDNGFGAKANSADATLRAYSVRIDWKNHRVAPADWRSGRERDAFDARTRLSFNDANRLLTVPIQADYEHYYDDATKPVVDASIRSGRLLTGADFDIESVRQDRDGNYWLGDEFGPYLIKTDRHGTVLRAQIPLPGVWAPENVEVLAGTATAILCGSGGFEFLFIYSWST